VVELHPAFEPFRLSAKPGFINDFGDTCFLLRNGSSETLEEPATDMATIRSMEIPAENDLLLGAVVARKYLVEGIEIDIEQLILERSVDQALGPVFLDSGQSIEDDIFVDSSIIIRCAYGEAQNLGFVEIDVAGVGTVADAERTCDAASSPCVLQARPGSPGEIALTATPAELFTGLSDDCDVIDQQTVDGAIELVVRPGTCSVDFTDYYWRASLNLSGAGGPDVVPVVDGVPVSIGSDGAIEVEDDVASILVGFPVPNTTDQFFTIGSASGSCTAVDDITVRVNRDGFGASCAVTLGDPVTNVLAFTQADTSFDVDPGPSGGRVECSVDAGEVTACTLDGQPVSLPLTYDGPTEVFIEAGVDDVQFGGDCVLVGPGQARVTVDGATTCSIQLTNPTQNNGTIQLGIEGGFGDVAITDTTTGLSVRNCAFRDPAMEGACEVMSLPEFITLTPTPDAMFTTFVGFEPPPASELGPDERGCPAQAGPGALQLDLPALAAPDPARRVTFRCRAVFECTALAGTQSLTLRLRDGAGVQLGEQRFDDPDATCTGQLCMANFTAPVGLAQVEVDVSATGFARLPDEILVLDAFGVESTVPYGTNFTLLSGTSFIRAEVETCEGTFRLQGLVTAN
jgi:hypothetical protein